MSNREGRSCEAISGGDQMRNSAIGTAQRSYGSKVRTLVKSATVEWVQVRTRVEAGMAEHVVRTSKRAGYVV